MKILFSTILFLMFAVSVQANSIYLWNSVQNGEASCCLCLSGTDYCNPQVACTGRVQVDLYNILGYLTRVLSVDKNGTHSHAKMIMQAQYYIRHVISTSFVQLNYRCDVYREIQFMHELTPEKAATSKNSAKGSNSSATTATADKAKADDVVWRYLVKLGLARPHGKK